MTEKLKKREEKEKIVFLKKRKKTKRVFLCCVLFFIFFIFVEITTNSGILPCDVNHPKTTIIKNEVSKLYLTQF